MKSERYCHFRGSKRKKYIFNPLLGQRIAIIKEKWSSNILYYQIESNLGKKESEKLILHFFGREEGG